MEITKKHDCVYHSKMYPNGSEVHGYMHCTICINGEWHDVDEGADDSKVSLAYVYH
jgi:hypothetical protein